MQGNQETCPQTAQASISSVNKMLACDGEASHSGGNRYENTPSHVLFF